MDKDLYFNFEQDGMSYYGMESAGTVFAIMFLEEDGYFIVIDDVYEGETFVDACMREGTGYSEGSYDSVADIIKTHTDKSDIPILKVCMYALELGIK